MNRQIFDAVVLAAALLVVVTASTRALFSPPHLPASDSQSDVGRSFFPLPYSARPSAEKPSPAGKPEELSTLFGFEPSQDASQGRPSRRKELVRSRTRPLAARSPPLRYVGWTNGNGQRLYLFVNVQTGRVFRLALEREESPWRMVELADEGFVLTDGTNSYRVERR